VSNGDFEWTIYLESHEEIYERRTDDGQGKRREEIRRRMACDDNGQCPVRIRCPCVEVTDRPRSRT